MQPHLPRWTEPAKVSTHVCISVDVVANLGKFLLQCVFGLVNVVRRSVATEVNVFQKLNMVRLQYGMHDFGPRFVEMGVVWAT